MPSAQDRAERPNAAGERQSLVHRLLALPADAIAFARRRPLALAVVLCGTSIICGASISAAYYVIARLPSSHRSASIDSALKLLDAGDYDEAKQMAQRLRQKIGDDYRQLGHPLFIQGAVLAQEAAQLGHENERQTIYLVAARYLEESCSRGLPPGREKEGLFLLATSLYNAGQFAESLPKLREAFEQLPNQKHELARLISSAYVHDTAPNLKEAIHFNRIWLDDPALTPRQRDQAMLQQAEVLLDQKDMPKCHDALGQIGDESPLHGQALVLQARLAMLEGDELVAGSAGPGGATDGKAKYRQAIGALGNAQSKDDLEGKIARQSQYLIGICHEKLGDFRAARAAFERTQRGYYGTPEALAATLAEAENAQRQGRGDIALAKFLKTTEEAGPSSLYRNRWVSLKSLKERLHIGQHRFVAEKDFDAALTMANAFNALFQSDEVAAVKAETHEAWAEHLLDQADGQGHAAAELTRAEARRQFRLAAAQYRTLAELRFATDEYSTDLWKSGSCFLRGQNYLLAIKLLREHLASTPRKQTPIGLVSLGECHLALGHHNIAIDVLDECIQFFPKHPESYRARLLASIAYSENGKLAKAQELLIENLHKSSLTPRSRYWRESLLFYGKLLFRDAHIREEKSRELLEGKTLASTSLEQRKAVMRELKLSHDLFQKAIASLEETAMREEKAAQEAGRPSNSTEARYYIAEAYRHSATLPKWSWEIEPTQTRRNTLRQQMRAFLQEAARAHRELQDQLARKQNYAELSAVDQRVLRNTYFASADTLFALEKYDQAITAYVTATNRYQHEPEAIEALMQIGSCYRRLNATAEARGTMLQAKSVLSRIPKDADFTTTTRYDRKQWEQLIDWLAKL